MPRKRRMVIRLVSCILVGLVLAHGLPDEPAAADRASDQAFAEHMGLVQAARGPASSRPFHTHLNRSTARSRLTTPTLLWKLSVSQIQFVVMSSQKLQAKAQLAHRTWCAIPGVRCLFVSDGHFEDGRGNELPSLHVVPRRARDIDPRRCCKHDRGFFCGEHRQATMPAQYRFLPALIHAKSLPQVRSGDTRWVIVVDDDSFVFMGNLLQLLRTLDPREPVYFGDVHPTKRLVCGGGGSVFSVAALHRMDVNECIASMHGHCMQSDWMIGECAKRARVKLLTQFTCYTCADGARKWYKRVVKALPRCYFIQIIASFLDWLPFRTATPAIIHGIPTDRLEATFQRLMNTSGARLGDDSVPSLVGGSRGRLIDLHV